MDRLLADEPAHLDLQLGVGHLVAVAADRAHEEVLAVGEHRRAGLLLHHGPQRFLDQVGDLAAGPRAVVHLGEPVVDHRFQAQRRRLSELLITLGVEPEPEPSAQLAPDPTRSPEVVSPAPRR